MMLRSFLFSVLIVNVVNAMADGAPNDPVVCRDMKPKHSSHTPQNSPSPYILQAENNGNEVLVTISAATEDIFSGFFLQAREVDDSLIGTFDTLESLAKTTNCLGGVNNAVTHNTRDNKTSIASYWTPPGGVPQNVTFKLTMVRNYAEFWVGQTLFFNPSDPSTSTASTNDWDTSSTTNDWDTSSTTNDWDTSSTTNDWDTSSTTNDWDTTPSAPGSAILSSYSNINVVVHVLIGYKLLS